MRGAGRYYDLSVYTTTEPTRLVKRWTSFPDGKYDPGALNVQFDMTIAPYDIPIGGQTIIIEGVSLADLQQAQEYTNYQIVLKAGMAQGLPLANPKQAGMIASGFIFQSYANWEGTEMNLNFVIMPSQFTVNQPGNITLSWNAGTPLEDALTQSLKTAYPGIPININISPNLVSTNNEIGYFASLSDLGQTLSGITQSLGHSVSIVFQNGVINVFDDTYNPLPVELQFTELVGQPSWVEVNIMQIKLVLRADLQVGDFIKMPKGLKQGPGSVIIAGASFPSSLKYKSAFQGVFEITEMRHVGNSRAADGTQWVTIINCAVTGND